MECHGIKRSGLRLKDVRFGKVSVGFAQEELRKVSVRNRVR